jgi:hypothetical protein
MSLRKKPLVRFDNLSRAQLVGTSTTSRALSRKSMPSRKRTSGRGKKVRSTKGKPRVIKGRVNVRVSGYVGVQKIAPSKLIPYLPANKVKLAVKKALVASGVRPTRGKKTGGKKQNSKQNNEKKKGKKFTRRRKKRTG